MSGPVLPLLAGLGLLGGIAMVAFVASLTKNIYQLKVQVQSDMDREVNALKDFVEKEMAQRNKWLMNDVQKDTSERLELLQGELTEMENRLQADLRETREALKKISALQQAMMAKKKTEKPAPKLDALPVKKASDGVA